MGCAWHQTTFWRDSETLWTHTLECTSQNFVAHTNMGLALLQIGRSKEAIEHYQQAIRLRPSDPMCYNNLGNALAKTGRPHEAIEHFKQEVQIKPDYIGAYNLLAVAYASVNQSSQAVAAAQKALDLARSQGQTALAGQIEDWLNSYHGQTPSSKVQNKDQ